MNATATNTAQLVLQDSRSLLFYNKDLGGFSEPNKDNATRLDAGTSQPAFIRAHFQNPQFIVEVPLVEAPTPDNAHLNPHINGTIKRRAIPSNRWDYKTYIFGDWSITCYQYNQNKGAHSYLRSTRPDYVPLWNAYNKATKESFECKDGGIKRAQKMIVRHEMKRHGI
jgi:hypothetical protein